VARAVTEALILGSSCPRPRMRSPISLARNHEPAGAKLLVLLSILLHERRQEQPHVPLVRATEFPVITRHAPVGNRLATCKTWVADELRAFFESLRALGRGRRRLPDLEGSGPRRDPGLSEKVDQARREEAGALPLIVPA